MIAMPTSKRDPPAHPPRRAVPHRQRLRHAGVCQPGRPVAVGGRARPAAAAGRGRSAQGLHHPARAKHVIFLFMNGGLSQVDSFDPKPMLEKYHGQPLPGGTVATERKTGSLMKSPFTFKRYGKSGLEVSELFPHVGACADDICVIRSMHTDIPNHEPSMLMMNTGHIQVGRPSIGLVAHLRARHREQEPARLRRALPRRADHGRAAAVEQRVPAGGAPGHVHPEQGRAARSDRRQGLRSEEAGLVHPQQGVHAAGAAARARLARLARRDAARQRRRPTRSSKRRSARWKWPTGCRPRRRTCSTSARRARRRSSCTGRAARRAAA